MFNLHFYATQFNIYIIKAYGAFMNSHNFLLVSSYEIKLVILAQ